MAKLVEKRDEVEDAIEEAHNKMLKFEDG